jgi:hypothetical protein
MPPNTRSQTAASVRFRMNLTSAIHRLPNEILAHIFVIGCPTSNHKLSTIDVAPLQHQVLVGSICKLWRKIAHECPALWTSVAIRYPTPRNNLKSLERKLKLKFYEEMIFSVLRRSGTMEVDLFIRIDSVPDLGKSADPYYDLVVPHLQRAHTIDVEYRGQKLRWPLRLDTRELPKLRHFYIKGSRIVGNASIFPSCAGNPPLETFSCKLLCSFNVSTIPTSRLRYVQIFIPSIKWGIARFASKCSNLEVLELRGSTWEHDAIISSATLTHLDLHAWRTAQLPTRLLDGLPNLVHLRLQIVHVNNYETPLHSLSWAPPLSLRSLSIDIGRTLRPYTPYGLAGLLRGTPRLVALQINEVDAPEVIEFIRTHQGEELDDGFKRKPLRLLLLATTDKRQVQKRWGDLTAITPVLRNWDGDEQAEWHSEQCMNPIVINGVEVGLHVRSAQLSPPFNIRADQMTD